jgi:acyl-CoA synthetase (AMP-forming)/AMP-acid ligase II/surface polysaccharide O-acyltransferase-like enzyme
VGGVCQFAARLEDFGDAIAAITDEGARLTYRELAARADEFAARLAGHRQLVALQTTNELEPLIAYLGALRGGHVVMLTTPGAPTERLYEAFPPSARYELEGGEWRLILADAPPPDLHPELAILLSTSGSTGATKLVRLSAASIDANAQSIVEYLGLTAAERAITTLPFHYSYGMSIVNSHLAVGATLLLTERSVVDPAFWSFFGDRRATSLAGVPHTYELLERTGFRDKDLPSLTCLTQAGGRLSPEMVRTYAQWAAAHGARLFVMYGQTEAAPRMAYLPPEQAQAHPDCIGVPIPGGAFRLLDEDGGEIETPDHTGELVYAGPNVMLGYATAAADLAKGRELEVLETGDLAVQLPEGLYRIVGRKSRFAKLWGLRISLDEVEARLERMGVRGVAVSDDALVYVAVTAAVDGADVARKLADEYKIPETSFHFERFDEIPTLASGKFDYRAILRHGQEAAKAAPPAGNATNPIEQAFRHAFPRHDPGPDDSFVSLGGDSLNYVTLSLDLERSLGYLPEAWESLTLAELEALHAKAVRRPWWSFRQIETEMVLRALAVLAVVVNHVSDWIVGGGAEVLMILAGYNLARYQRPRLVAGTGFQFVWSFFKRIIVPYYLLLIGFLALQRDVDVPSLLLVSNFVGRFGSMIEPYWFLEAILQCLVIFVGLSFFPPVRRAIETNPWRFGLALLAASIAVRVGAFAVFHHDGLVNRTPDSNFYLLALGWCAQVATTRSRRWLLTGVMLALAVIHVVGAQGLWRDDPGAAGVSHAVWLAACAGGLMWVRRIPIPSVLHAPLGAIAAASFYIYLTHVAPVWLLYWRFGVKSVAVNVAVAVVIGVASWWAVTQWDRRRAARKPI